MFFGNYPEKQRDNVFALNALRVYRMFFIEKFFVDKIFHATLKVGISFFFFGNTQFACEKHQQIARFVKTQRPHVTRAENRHLGRQPIAEKPAASAVCFFAVKFLIKIIYPSFDCGKRFADIFLVSRHSVKLVRHFCNGKAPRIPPSAVYARHGVRYKPVLSLRKNNIAKPFRIKIYSVEKV